MSEKAVPFNASTTADVPSIVSPTYSILMGLYGTAAMLLADPGSTLQRVGMLTTLTGGATYYYTFFGR